MAVTKKNQNLMHLIKRMHSRVENTDIEKHRLSQDHLGVLFGSNKEVDIKEIVIDNIHCEWIS
ncbi:MAG: alpha/beta hydrolase, partial [Lachnospiraceae bacterium]|nr:alpha/beta hydrolase [Lachnospiraceae bacterium]